MVADALESGVSAEPSDDTPVTHRRSPWTTLRWVLLAAYGVGYVWWFATRGIIINHVLVLSSLALFFAVASVGRPPRAWVRAFGDFLLFAVLWLFYAESRGLADGLGFPIQVESVRNIDRVLFLGNDGVVWLQQTFLEPIGTVRWYDVIGSMVYYSHFIVPPVTIALLWFLNRQEWLRFMRRFATLLVIACGMFVVLPTAPPWMAGDPAYGYGALPPLRRPTGNGWRHIGLDAAVQAWDTGRDWANPVAAMPSLHSAFSLFVVVFAFRWVTSWRWRAVMLLYPAVMAVSLMYFAEHYFVDALAGWAIVGVSFALWARIEDRLERRSDSSDGPTDVAPTGDVPIGDTSAGDVDERQSSPA
ncbi:MAG: phosphatase PAP2 family protein [Actinomycetota bacterium]